jgi:glycosyltransferase involved in cell wall biosynthesis
MTNNKKIVFIGPISPPVTGPGVKNKEIIDALLRKDIEVIQINSLNWTKKFFSFFGKIIQKSLKQKRVLLSISKKGRYILMPLMYFLKLFFGIQYILLPAGGNLDKEIGLAFPLYKTLFLLSLKNASRIYVESRSLVKGLENLGLNNVEYMPNPRHNQHFQWKLKNNTEKQIVFLSKIKAEKGVVVLVDAVNKLLADNAPIFLDFYGPIDKKFEKEFFQIISDNDRIKYNGISEPKNVQKILAEADIFVLPTMWKNEGLPGVLVEASFTGVPLIISRFRASEEFIEHNKNGLIVEPGQIDELSKSIKLLIESDELAAKLSKEFLKLSSAFDVDSHAQTILDEMKKLNWNIS